MITVRLPEEQAQRLDELVAEGSYKTRAAAVTTAIERLLEDAERDRIDRAIVEGYTRLPQTQDEIAYARAAGRRSVAAEPW
jgi:Arc/MetJ-type ribon-helix-helix transcriptional regulator